MIFNQDRMGSLIGSTLMMKITHNFSCKLWSQILYLTKDIISAIGPNGPNHHTSQILVAIFKTTKFLWIKISRFVYLFLASNDGGGFYNYSLIILGLIIYTNQHLTRVKTWMERLINKCFI